ncbi:hypothetical protein [Blastopirellula marina]|uniref:Uncharacterized protein n=1 Tax=Blastopirellula marina TaxID=124 RepID=A0A2S8GIE9_9BACT|nr:hypothetical protein [Blastopirellula marina]PQO44217.1 hypothetical protein C5Y93_19790 [Blastopirellula marina]
MSATTKTPQELLCEQLTAATDGKACFDWRPFYTLDDKQGGEIPETKGRTFYACTLLGEDPVETLDDWFSDTNGDIVEQAIERFEQRACVLMDIINGLHDYDAKRRPNRDADGRFVPAT